MIREICLAILSGVITICICFAVLGLLPKPPVQTRYVVMFVYYRTPRALARLTEGSRILDTQGKPSPLCGIESSFVDGDGARIIVNCSSSAFGGLDLGVYP